MFDTYEIEINEIATAECETHGVTIAIECNACGMDTCNTCTNCEWCETTTRKGNQNND